MLDKYKIWIIVLNWNGIDDTLACLKSLSKAQGRFQILLVDNGSTDDSPAIINQKFPDIKILRLNENIGFCKANNLGMKEALKSGAEKIILLNNDTIVESNLILELDRVSQDQQIGLAGPLIYYYSDQKKLWPSIGRIYLWFANHRSAKNLSQVQNLKKNKISFLSGCCLLIKKEVIKKIGLLDEEFFAYFEDTDYCMRTQKAGYRLALADQAKIYHKVTRASGGKYSDICTYFFNRNNLLFAKKYLFIWQWPVFIVYFLFFRILGLLFKANPQFVFLGISDFFKNKFGKPDFMK